MTEEIRVRYAPSPTGHLHIGNARTAIFNYLFARNMGGKFIIRMEDTDLKRNVTGGEGNQLKYLRWLGIDWDESVDVGGGFGPYRQTERLDIYQIYWQELLDKGLAYPCYCSEEELEREREEQALRGEMPRYSGIHRDLTKEQCEAYKAQGRLPSIRFRVPENTLYIFDDMVKGSISFDSSGSGDFVIVRKDGIPTYNFAVVIDDHLMRISHVLRGEDHISNTPRQLMIYEALGWQPPRFAHMTLIVNQERKKLSKRDESIVQFIEQYDNLGYLPETLFNFITLLGWSPEGEEEIFTREDLIRIFDANRLSKSPAVFDTDKLSWMNNHYFKKTELSRIVSLCIPYLQKAGRIPENLNETQFQWVTTLIGLFQDKMRYAGEIVELTAVFFAKEVEVDEEAKSMLIEAHVPIVLSSFLKLVVDAEKFTPDRMKAMLKQVQLETGYKGQQLYMSIRVALTGQMHGPDLNQSLYLLGREKVANRLQYILSSFV